MKTTPCPPLSAATSGPPAARLAPGSTRLALALALVLALPQFAGAASAVEASADENLQKWQLRRLFQPTERERAHERDGYVYIYDGLTDRQVDRALELQFDRIEYMLFLGTRSTDETGQALKNASGKYLTESPGCTP
jgi:hypothetical protein